MSKDFDSESQSQIERTIMDSNVSSIEEVYLKPVIGEKVSDSVSSGFENDVQMNSENSFECEQEKQELVNADSDFIHHRGSSSSSSQNCSDIKENQEMSEDVLESVIKARSVIAYDSSFVVERQEAEENISHFENGVKMSPEISFKCEEEARKIIVQEKQETEEIFHVQNVIAGDDHIIVVVESQERVENDPLSISKSQNIVEMRNASRRSGDNWGCFNEKNISVKMSGSHSHGEILKGLSEFKERRGMVEIETQNSDRKLNISEVKEMPVNFPASISKTGNGRGRKEIGSMALGKKRSGSCSENIKQEMVRKKRNEKGMNKLTGHTIIKQNLLSLLAEARNVCQKKADGSKRRYSRSEMEALRFVNCVEQRQIWKEIYTGLGPVVARELNDMADSKFQKRNNGRNGRNSNQHQHAGNKKDNASILGIAAAKGRGIHMQIIEVKNG